MLLLFNSLILNKTNAKYFCAWNVTGVPAEQQIKSQKKKTIKWGEKKKEKVNKSLILTSINGGAARTAKARKLTQR